MTQKFPKAVAAYDLSQSEHATVRELLRGLEATYASAEQGEFLANARRLAFSSLPEGLVRFVDRFRQTEFASAIAITGFRVDDEQIGPTPVHWNAQLDPRSTIGEELLFMLIGALLGDAFGWRSLQNGRLVHNVVPVHGQEQEQSGHGSLTMLAWHTEDGFHPCRCDYLGLMGLRNDARVATTFSSIDAIRLTKAERRVLSQPRFLLSPDDEHINQRIRERASTSAAGAVVWHWPEPRPAAVLFGDPRRPYLRIDPYFMTAVPGDGEAARALERTVRKLDAALEDLVIEPGTICFLDNYRVVHGRSAFRANYNGRDRWLKKLLIACDLRKSRELRDDPKIPVLMPAMVCELARRSSASRGTTQRDGNRHRE